MPRLKINLEAIERDVNTNAEGVCADGGVRVGSLLVFPEGVRDSAGHHYELSLNDFSVVPETQGSFLGRGSSGSVRRAIHRRSNTVVALKEIKVSGRAHLSEIRRELETLHAGNNTTSYLVNFYGAFTHEGSVFIAMEAMDGSLQDIAKPVPVPVLACITRQMLKGLLYLHRTRHLMHRDLKPSNVLYNSRTGDIKISDFGVCSFLECTKADANSFVGTVTYMSPERLHGDSYSYSADIWSLGLVIAELALGVCPFAGLRGESSEGRFWALIQHLDGAGPALELPDDMDRTLADFINACVVKVPDQRATCTELLKHPFIIKYAASTVAPVSPTAALSAANGDTFLTPTLSGAATAAPSSGTSHSPIRGIPVPPIIFDGFPVEEAAGRGSGAAISIPVSPTTWEYHKDGADEDFTDHRVIRQWMHATEGRLAGQRDERYGGSFHHHVSPAGSSSESTTGKRAEGIAANRRGSDTNGDHPNAHGDESWEKSHGPCTGDSCSADVPHDGMTEQRASPDSQLVRRVPSMNLDEELNKLLL